MDKIISYVILGIGMSFLIVNLTYPNVITLCIGAIIVYAVGLYQGQIQ